MIHNHYEGFEMLLSLLEDINIDKSKECETEDSEFTDDFEDSFNSSNKNTNANNNTNNTNKYEDEENNELQFQLICVLCGMGARCPLICEKVYWKLYKSLYV